MFHVSMGKAYLELPQAEKNSPNAFRLKFLPEASKPQIFARIDFGYLDLIQQNRCFEWTDSQSFQGINSFNISPHQHDNTQSHQT